MFKLKRVPKKLWVLYIICVIIVILINISISPIIGVKQVNQCNCPECLESQPKVYQNIEDMTFVTVPRPVTKKEQFRKLKLAVSSWLASSPSSHVLMLISSQELDPTGTFVREIEKTFGKDRLIFASGLRTDLSGVPYINEWFMLGIDVCPSKYITFINSDILISAGWLPRVKQVYGALEGKNPFIIGQRIDFDLEDKRYDKLRFNQQNLLSDIDSMVQESKHSDHSPYGIDFFTFRADSPPFDPRMIPPFIMGRYNWDNWLIGYINNVCDSVTFNLDPPIYHMNHIRHNFDPNQPKVAINHHLKMANKGFFGSNYDTKYQVVNGFVESRRNKSEKYKLPEI